MNDAGPRRQVVILGAGFAGLEAAKKLGHLDVDVLVIDRRNHFTFQPLLYQVALAVLSPSDIMRPIRQILAGYRNIDVIMAEAVAVDRSARTVTLADQRTVRFDYLIVATGSNTSFFGHAEWQENSCSLKSIPDAIRIRTGILQAFEQAEADARLGKRARDFHFVVIGGGPTGVELAGAIADITQRVVRREFHHIRTQDARISIYEGSASVLAAFPPALQKKAAEQLQSLGIAVHTGARITEVGRDHVCVGSERVEATLVLWAAGVAPSSFGRLLGVPVDTRGSVVVDSFLNPPGEPNIFVCGDLAAASENGRRIPAVAQPAMQMGAHAARLIEADLRGQQRAPFHYFDKGDMATIGARKAVARVAWPFHALWSGRLAWLTWLFVHLAFLSGTDRQFSVLFTWLYTYLTKTARSGMISADDWPAAAEATRREASKKIQNEG